MSSADCEISTIRFSDRDLESDQFGRIEFQHGSYIQNDELGKPDWSFVLESSSTRLFEVGPETVRMVNVFASH
ncbi:MAG: hypothetical protein WAM82_26185, partial [Thermoanaerobaculia bacterium]